MTPQSGKNLRVVLEDDSQMLGEVQVVAYGAQKKVSITGAISSMKGEDLLKTPACVYVECIVWSDYRYFFGAIFW